jgi:hypothetical protein
MVLYYELNFQEDQPKIAYFPILPEMERGKESTILQLWPIDILACSLLLDFVIAVF